MNAWNRIQGKALQCNAMDEWHGQMNAMEWTYMNWEWRTQVEIHWNEEHKLQRTEVKANHMIWSDTEYHSYI